MPFLQAAVANQAALPKPQRSRRNHSGAEQEQEVTFLVLGQVGQCRGQALLTLLTCSLVLLPNHELFSVRRSSCWSVSTLAAGLRAAAQAVVLVLRWVALGSAWVRALPLSGIVVCGREIFVLCQSPSSGPILQR